LLFVERNRKPAHAVRRNPAFLAYLQCEATLSWVIRDDGRESVAESAIRVPSSQCPPAQYGRIWGRSPSVQPEHARLGFWVADWLAFRADSAGLRRLVAPRQLATTSSLPQQYRERWIGHCWLRRSFIELSPEWDEKSKKGVQTRYGPGVGSSRLHDDGRGGKVVLPCRHAFPAKAKSFFPGRCGAGWGFARAIRSMSMWKDNVLCSPCAINGLGRQGSSPIPSPGFRCSALVRTPPGLEQQRRGRDSCELSMKYLLEAPLF
jgi:hypothetical protein